MGQTSRRSSKSKGGKRKRRSAGAPGSRSFDELGTATLLPRNKKIYKAGQPADYLYRVATGCIRAYSELDGGRRHIHAFYYPGDYFGLEAGEQHHVSVETVTPSKIFLFKREALASRAARDVGVVRLLLRLAAMELQRAQNHSLLLLSGAQTRILDFLGELKRRKKGASEVDLPMPRSDVADYLGLTTESVSRALTRLKKASTIAMPTSRRFILRDPLPNRFAAGG